MASETAEADALVREIGETIVADEEYPDGFESLVLIGKFGEGHRGLNGYVFRADSDWGPWLPRSFVPLRLLRRLNDEMAERTGRRWCVCLVTLKSGAGKIDIEFEHDDPDRWPVTTGTLDWDTLTRDALALKPS